MKKNKVIDKIKVFFEPYINVINKQINYTLNEKDMATLFNNIFHSIFPIKSSIELVKEFMLIGRKEDVKENINLVDIELFKLRVSLLKEELEEFEVAYKNKDIVEVFDALLDLQYILDGTFICFGLTDVKEAGFLEVHASNMSKFTPYKEEIIETQKKYRKNGTETSFEKENKYWIIRRLDGKILKNYKYKEPNLKKIIDDYDKNK
jgi:predicted HAD superfamily Cof-like phosphohydrolase